MFDRFDRKIDCLRISVTDRCNLSCRYCRAGEARSSVSARHVLSVEEVRELVRVAVALGIAKVRLTGGEPLLRPEIVDIVRGLAATPGLQDLAMTTNGTWLAPLAGALRDAGLQRINISLDSLDPWRYRYITDGGELDRVLAGIAAAVTAGFAAIKLNCVIESSPDEPDARQVLEFGARNGFAVQLIPRMDLKAGIFSQVIGGNGGRCERCNRLRVSCDGRVFPCLFGDASYSIRELGAEAALLLAARNKPESGVRSDTAIYALGG
jgi:cyclic pyranopterin phosphate synthase